MAENLDVGISERLEIPIRLVFFLAQRGVKTAQHQLQPVERPLGHVAFALHIQVQLDRPQHAQSLARLLE